ncbi:MAG: Na+/H+ antiporter subunit E [Defluviitaleaceae bacterium]|nr:Na+/H+ antiporter subunit E [Defluviitaleaceae bacterium]
MIKIYIYIAVVLSVSWVLIAENTHWSVISSGVLVSIICIYASRKLLPLEPIKDICLIRLSLYPLFILGQIYLSGFYIIKLVFKGVKVEEIKTTTEVKNPFLRAFLASAVTLTPGSLVIDLQDEQLYVLWLREKNAKPVRSLKDPSDELKGSIEKYIKKMEV